MTMSEPKSSGKKPEKSASKPKAEAKAETTSKPKAESASTSSSSSASASSSGSSQIQNGKGDAPRNISPRFRKNFDGIRWDSTKKAKRQEGVKTVKVY